MQHSFLNIKNALGMLEHPLLGAHIAHVAALLQLGACCAVKNKRETDLHIINLRKEFRKTCFR